MTNVRIFIVLKYNSFPAKLSVLRLLPLRMQFDNHVWFFGPPLYKVVLISISEIWSVWQVEAGVLFLVDLT